MPKSTVVAIIQRDLMARPQWLSLGQFTSSTLKCATMPISSMSLGTCILTAGPRYEADAAAISLWQPLIGRRRGPKMP
jgi:hypothetical protein